MIKFDFILHSELTEEQLERVCELKSQHWKHDMASQKKWLNENFSPHDVHLLLFENDQLIGYLSLVHLKIEGLLESKTDIYGLGSVCVSIDQKGKHFGLLLMNLVNYYLHAKRAIGILLCKNELVPFYEKNGWIVFKGNVTIKKEPYNFFLMTTKTLNQSNISLPISF